MVTFLIAFVVLGTVIAGMSVGVMFKRKPIQGSCGGLNSIAGADKCVVCSRPIDPDNPLRSKLDCPRENAS